MGVEGRLIGLVLGPVELCMVSETELEILIHSALVGQVVGGPVSDL